MNVKSEGWKKGYDNMYQVIKRDGKITEFDLKKITRAIEKAFISLKKEDQGS